MCGPALFCPDLFLLPGRKLAGDVPARPVYDLSAPEKETSERPLGRPDRDADLRRWVLAKRSVPRRAAICVLSDVRGAGDLFSVRWA